MHLKKDCPKWKAIWLAIDIALLVLVMGVLGWCSWLAFRIHNIPNPADMTLQIQAQQDINAGLEEQVALQAQAVSQAEEDSLAALNTASQQLSAVQAELYSATRRMEELTIRKYTLDNSTDLIQQLKLDIAALRTQYGQTIRQLEDKILSGESTYRICYLTFDDGPSHYTSQFLDKLDALDIYATFFTIGVQMDEYYYPMRDELLRREALSGHSIANHTYTHALWGSLYKNLDNFMDAVNRQDQLVYDVTGMHTDLVRFPAGSHYCPFRSDAITELETLGYGWIDWIGNAYDSGTFRHTPERVAQDVIWQARQEQVIVVLMHDWREETLGALDTIVNTLKEENYLFLPLFKESSTVGTAHPKWDS